jgi:hypothetical protein
LSLSGFRAQLQARADPPQQDMPDGHHLDSDDTADFELPDQQALIDAFTAGLCPVKAKNETVPRRGGQGAPGRAAHSAQSRTQRRGPAAQPVWPASAGPPPESGRRAAAVNDHERAMNPTSRVSLTASHAGENSQFEPNQWPRTYDCIQHSNRPDLQLFKRSN